MALAAILQGSGAAAQKSAPKPPANEDTNQEKLRPFISGKDRFPDRFSHSQDPFLKKLAEESKDKFANVVDEQSGFDAGLLKSLASHTKIFEGLLDLKAKVSEEDFATRIGAGTWVDLAAKYYANVGLTNASVGENMIAHDLRLASRLTMLNSLASAYKAMILGQRILSEAAESELQKVSKSVTNLVSKSAESKTSTVRAANVEAPSDTITINTVLMFFKAFEEAGKEAKANVILGDKLDVTLRSLYEEIDASKDGMSLSMVVPIVGSGLNDESLLVLTNHVAELRLAVLKTLDKVLSENASDNHFEGDMKDFIDACREVINPIIDTNQPIRMAVTSALYDVDTGNRISVKAAGGGDKIKASTNPYLYSGWESLEQLSHSNRSSSRKARQLLTEPASMTEERREVFGRIFTNRISKKMHFIRSASSTNLAKITKLAKAAHSNQVSLFQYTIAQKAFNSGGNQALTDADRPDLQTAAIVDAAAAAKSNFTNLIEQVDRIANDLDDLGFKLSNNLKAALSASGAVLSKIDGVDPQDLGNSIKAILFDTSFWSGVDTNLTNTPLISSSKIRPEDIKFISEGISDILNQTKAEQARLLTVTMELTANRTRLHQETLRHLQALGAVVAKELRRWNGLYTIHEHYETAFLGDGQNMAFGDGANVPPIDRNSRVMPAIQILADHARILHDGPPLGKDAASLIAAHDSVNHAIALVQGYFLMDVFNRRYGNENSLLLNREIQEHDLHLASIRNKVTESVIRLAIADQVAFHSTGWTKEDFANIIRLLQSAWLGQIAQK